MLRSLAIADIKRGLGYRQTQDSTIIAKLQEAQRQLELGRTLPNFLISYDEEITVTASTAEVALPARFIRLVDEYDMYYTNTYGNRVFIPRRNYTEAYQAYVASGEADASDVTEDTSEGYPQVFVLKNKTTAILVPTPTVSFTMYLTCYVGAEILDSEIENSWLLNAPDVLIGLAGMKVAATLRDKGAIELFSGQYKLGLGGLLGDIIEDELAGRGLVMGRNN